MTSHTALTATIFLPMQCRLVCGREDGSIIMVPATQTIMLHLLAGRHQKFNNWPQHQVTRATLPRFTAEIQIQWGSEQRASEQQKYFEKREGQSFRTGILVKCVYTQFLSKFCLSFLIFSFSPALLFSIPSPKYQS